MLSNKKIIVVAAAYDEEGKIGETVRKVKEFSPFVDEVVVVNDCSKDNTVNEAKAAGATVVSHEVNKGAGAAYRTGYIYGLEHGYDIIVEVAGDNQDDPSYIKKIVTPILEENYDYIQGTRYKSDVKIVLPWFRHVTTRLYSVVFSLAARKWVTDASTGFRAFKSEILRDSRINLNQKWLERYELEPYFLLEVIKNGYKFKEIGAPKYWPKGKSYSKMIPFKSWWQISRPMIYSMFGIKKK
jgi:dolichol-phosphate mannosyltransferase